MTHPQEHDSQTAGSIRRLADARPEPDRVANGTAESSSLWREWLQGSTPQERALWLQLAKPSGVLYAHQVKRAAGDRKSHLLSELLAGRLDLIAPSTPANPPIERLFDPELDHVQRDAVEQALATPDVFLMQGNPGTGKSRVVAELIAQAVGRGLRVLFLAPSCHAIDPVLERLAVCEGVVPLRCLGPQQRPEDLPPQVRSLTLAAQTANLGANTLARAKARQEASRQQLHSLKHNCDALVHLRRLADEWQGHDKARLELAARRQQLAAQVEQDALAMSLASPLGAALAGEQQRHAEAGRELDAACKQSSDAHGSRRAENERWSEQLRKQERLLKARHEKGVFSLQFWRAVLQGRPEERRVEFQSRCEETQQALDQAAAALAEVRARQQMEAQRHETARTQIIQLEMTRLLADVDQQLERRTREQRDLETPWADQRRGLSRPELIPDLPDVNAVQHAYMELDRQCQDMARQLEFAGEWCATLHGLVAHLPARFLAAVNVVAACTPQGNGELSLGDAGLERQRFDLLVLEQCDRLSDAELLAHARRAERWVLVGQTPLPDSLGAIADASPAAGNRPEGAFDRLWRLLHCDPRQLPYQWLEDAGRLICRLTSAVHSPAERVETEHLVDHPEVELRIVNRPAAAPALAEVSFPVGQFSIESAKAFLYQQLSELTLRPGAPALRWYAQPERLVLDIGHVASPELAECGCELEEGVREIVQRLSASANGSGTIHWGTARLEFDAVKGWSRQRAEGWLRERTGLGILGRTALLENQYRAPSEIAAFAARILAEREVPRCTRLPRPLGVEEFDAVVQFIAVPLQRGRPRPRQRGPQRPAPPPAKSFEIDLSDQRQRQRLPLDLQLKLPPKGIVNFAEAQAVMNLLDALVRQSASSAAGVRAPLHAAILSWQQPQVHFMEALWAHASAGPSAVQVVFDTIANFREREADVVLISLCRSNAQHITPFADFAEDWRGAFMAARSHLVLFGDLDMLQRRSRHEGPLARLGASAADLERAIASALLRHVDAQSSANAALQGAGT